MFVFLAYYLIVGISTVNPKEICPQNSWDINQKWWLDGIVLSYAIMYNPVCLALPQSTLLAPNRLNLTWWTVFPHIFKKTYIQITKNIIFPIFFPLSVSSLAPVSTLAPGGACGGSGSAFSCACSAKAFSRECASPTVGMGQWSN